MSVQRNMRNAALAAALSLLAAGGAAGQEDRAPGPGADAEDPVAELLEQLARPDQEGWRQIESAIAMEWSKSGSPAMDLLLQRARDAMEEEAFGVALEHLGALTDHAPHFAEGWNTKATAHFRREEYGLALDALARTLALEPRHFGAMIGLATILREIGDEQNALRTLREAHRLHPHRPNVIDGIETLSRQLEGETL
jgi:Flp pilus assembly protein TadD